MSLFTGAETINGVYVGSGLAQAVYLGTEKVWPTYVASQSPWYKYSSSQTIVPWPLGAEFCDVVVIGGGAGGTGTGIGGNPPKGGAAGAWEGWTIPRTEGARTYTEIGIQWQLVPGKDGGGGGNFNTEAARGSYMSIYPRTGAPTGGNGPERTGASAMPMSSGNRNGGNVAPTYIFNSRTYTLASYGTGAGQGGASSNKNGSDGTRPGGGGQSADNGGLTGYNGGNGAHGAALLYWYSL